MQPWILSLIWFCFLSGKFVRTNLPCPPAVVYFLFYGPFSLYSLESASIKLSSNKKLCTCLPLPAIQIENRPQSVHACMGPPEWITWMRSGVSLITCHSPSCLISFSRTLRTFSRMSCTQYLINRQTLDMCLFQRFKLEQNIIREEICVKSRVRDGS